MADISSMVDAVIRRLVTPRIGVLWFYGEGSPMPESPHFTWVHYVSGRSPQSQHPVYRVAEVEPRKEAFSLSMLIMPGACARVLGEVFSGFPVTNEARLLDSCIGMMPVVIDTTRMDRWFAENEPHNMGTLHAARCCLASRGVTFVSPRVRLEAKPAPKILLIDTPGWLSWAEISEKLGVRKAVRFGRDTKITPQAQDNLRSRGITIEFN